MMKIVRIDGGLGNQMFDYALLVAFREKFQEDVLFDASRYKYFFCHNGFELERIFEITARQATAKEILRYSYYSTNKFLSKIFSRLPRRRYEHVLLNVCKDYPNLFESGLSGYYIGFWQNYKYFDEYKDAILREFSYRQNLTGKNLLISEQMLENEKSVSIHIRRGDYLLESKYQGICELDYYKNAIDYLKTVMGESLSYYIFSNDIEWCRANIGPLTEGSMLEYVDWNCGLDSYLDMRLMSCCRANVIANSSFSWWAAYINARKDKIVVSPYKWINRTMEFKIQPEEWMCL